MELGRFLSGISQVFGLADILGIPQAILIILNCLIHDSRFDHTYLFCGPTPLAPDFLGGPFPCTTNRHLLFYLRPRNQEDFINSMSPKKTGRWKDQVYPPHRYTLLAFSWWMKTSVSTHPYTGIRGIVGLDHW